MTAAASPALHEDCTVILSWAVAAASARAAIRRRIGARSHPQPHRRAQPPTAASGRAQPSAEASGARA
jgi:hypothetical protein